MQLGELSIMFAALHEQQKIRAKLMNTEVFYLTEFMRGSIWHRAQIQACNDIIQDIQNKIEAEIKQLTKAKN